MKVAFHKVHKEAGFSLVELMIVVGIIGLLATLAIPRFQQFQAKAKMAEAKTTLSHIYTLQEAYHLDNNTYQAFTKIGYNAGWGTCSNAEAKALGFEIQPCGPVAKLPRFGYEVNPASATAFTAIASTGTGANNLVCPNASSSITMRIDEKRLMDGGSAGKAVPSACP